MEILSMIGETCGMLAIGIVFVIVGVFKPLLIQHNLETKKPAKGRHHGTRNV